MIREREMDYFDSTKTTIIEKYKSERETRKRTNEQQQQRKKKMK